MNAIRTLMLIQFFCCALFASNAPAFAWQPAKDNRQIPIWPATPPDTQAAGGAEVDNVENKTLVAGKPWTYVGNVRRPTITVYFPKENNTGAAVLVLPGGGYQILAMDLEGTEVCDWLTSRGIAAILVKYRVPGEGKYPKSGPYPDSRLALEDAQRALSLVRYRAADWQIDKDRIGVLGFSAGGHLSVALSNHFDRRVYRPIDDIDKQSCRPDFAVVLYPGHLALGEHPVLNPDIQVTKNTPPTFIVQAEDDPVDRVENSLVYYAALRKAKVPVEMHLYAHGGHAFGLRRTNQLITAWPDLMESWLRNLGLLSN
jgi:acetyl esterase/lipase